MHTVPYSPFPEAFSKQAQRVRCVVDATIVRDTLLPWLDRLYDHRSAAIGAEERRDALLAEWEARLIPYVQQRLERELDKSAGLSEPSQVIRMDLLTLEVAFLIHTMAFAVRRSQQSREPGARIERRLAEQIRDQFWARLNADSPVFYVIPFRHASELILPHLESHARLYDAGISPPDSDSESDAWYRSYANRLRVVINHQSQYIDDDATERWIIVMATPFDIALLGGAILGMGAAASNPRDQELAREAFDFLVEFADPESNRRLRSMRDRIFPKSTVRAAPTPGHQSTPYGTVALQCSACGTMFRSRKPYCPNCDTETDQRLEWLKLHGYPTAYTLEEEIEKSRAMPDEIPWGVLIASGFLALALAFATHLFDRSTGRYFIFLFPAGLGAATGFLASVMAINRSKFFRPYYFAIPMLLAVGAYASTFWMDYEATIGDVEALGYVNVRESISFTDYIDIRAQQPFSISRRWGSSTIAGEDPNSGDWYLLWTVEAGAAAGGAYWGWRRGIRLKHRLDELAP